MPADPQQAFMVNADREKDKVIVKAPGQSPVALRRHEAQQLADRLAAAVDELAPAGPQR